MNKQVPDILSDQAQSHLNRTILKLAWPAILEQFLICMASLADTAMVGSIGASATAAVAVNISSIWLINGFITSLSVGFSYLISHAVGSGDDARSRRITAQGLVCAAILGLLLALGVELICHPLPIWLGAAPEVIPQAQRYMQIIGYGLTAQTLSVVLSAIFRSAGNTRIPLAANLTSNAANIVGNFFLIYPARSLTIGSHTISIWGAGLGVAGAACSTMLSQMLLLVILLVFLTTAKTPIRLNPFHTDYHVERQVLGQLWHISIPVLLERLTLTSGQVALTAMISGLGTISLAAHYLTNQTEGLLYLPAYGFAYTATALVGQALVPDAGIWRTGSPSASAGSVLPLLSRPACRLPFFQGQSSACSAGSLRSLPWAAKRCLLRQPRKSSSALPSSLAASAAAPAMCVSPFW